MTEEKRLNVKVEAELHEQFVEACKLQDTTMSDAITDFMSRYIKLYGIDQDLPQKRLKRILDADESPNL
jgi:antitoxin component of RelBE/YafQ-DinJ toxin-antitoxin module